MKWWLFHSDDAAFVYVGPIMWGESLFLPPRAEQIMIMPAQTSPTRRWTLEEFYEARDAAPQGVRYELVDGEILVTPSRHWTHQRISAQLFVLLHAYVRAQDLGEAFMPPLDVLLEPNLVLQPDLLVVPRGLLRKRSDIVNRLLLAAEVISPSSARHDRVRKRPVYQRNRVPDYWVIDDRADHSGQRRIILGIFLGRLGGSPGSCPALLFLVLLGLWLKDEGLSGGEGSGVIGIGHQRRVIHRRQRLGLLELLVEPGLALGLRLQDGIGHVGADEAH